MDICHEIHQAIREEIQAQKQNLDLREVRVESIQFVSPAVDGYIYQLELERRVRLSADQPITLIQKGQSHEGSVVDVKDFTVLIFLHQRLDEEGVRIGKLSFDPTFILDALEKRLIDDKWLESPFTQQIVQNQLPQPFALWEPLAIPRMFNERQQKAIQRSLSDPIHIIWGPPGTGKTKTMGQIIVQQIRRSRSCLLLSVSNVAVDQLLKAVLESSTPEEKRGIIRLGIPCDRSLDIYTPHQRVLANDSEAARQFKTLEKKREEFQNTIKAYRIVQSKSRQTSKANDELGRQIGSLYLEIQQLQEKLNGVREQLHAEGVEIISDSGCIATTLASLVVHRELRNLSFDTVCVDEISMVPLLFILAASHPAHRNLTLAGDPQQLPPIFVSEEPLVQKWLGKNSYDFLNIRTPDEHPNVTFLNKQYRMQKPISDVVNQLSYEGQLQIGTSPRQEAHITVIPIEPNPAYGEYGSYYSIYEGSYYFPFSVLVIAALTDIEPAFFKMPTLLLSPFRAQEKLFSKLVSDLPVECASSATIHRSQGSESDTVILDLTIYDPSTKNRFFQDATETKKLLNVAMTRAKTQLIILCSLEMLRTLGRQFQYYLDLYNQLFPHAQRSTLLHSQIGEKLNRVDDWLPEIIASRGTCLYAALPSDTNHYLQQVARKLKKLDDNSPVIIGRNHHSVIDLSGGVWRRAEADKVPPMALCGGYLFLHMEHLWVGQRLANTANALRTIAAGHLLDEEIDIQRDGGQLICGRCGHGMEPVNIDRTFRMCCSNSDCGYRRRLTFRDVRMMIELHRVECPACRTKMVPRQSRGEFFCGCPNYPQCRGTRKLYDFTMKTDW